MRPVHRGKVKGKLIGSIEDVLVSENLLEPYTEVTKCNTFVSRFQCLTLWIRHAPHEFPMGSASMEFEIAPTICDIITA